MLWAINVLLLVVVNFIAIGEGNECIPRDYGNGSVVCVCNSTYCDFTARMVPPRGQYRIYESGKSGKRMSQSLGNFTECKNHSTENIISLNPEKTFQVMHGFGGAMTDSAAINIGNLSHAAQELLLETYYGANGTAYRFSRIPIGSTDFSTRRYSLDDHSNDLTLQRFQLSDEDLMMRIPLLKRVKKYYPDLQVIAAAWSAPSWMKTNNNYTGYGYLKKEYYQTFADYLTRFLTEYKRNGVEVRGLSTGNEPQDILTADTHFDSMGWTPEGVADFIANNLGPTIAASSSNETLLFVLDDDRTWLPEYIEGIFANSKAKSYSDVIAIHWYYDGIVVPDVLDSTHELFPDKIILITEGCVGNFPFSLTPVILGDWSRAERYILDLMQNFQHWVSGYVDWNLALDMQGGPNWVHYYADSPIIVDPGNDEFLKQPTYYAIAHFSKFITHRSRRIQSTNIDDINNVAFLTPDNEIVQILYNKNNETKSVMIEDPNYGTIMTKIPPYSVQTILYRR